MRTALTAYQVAAALQISARSFAARRKRLEEEHGFPRPLPGLGLPRWDPAALEDWQNARRSPSAVQAAEGDIAGAEARLIARARALAGV